MSDSVPSSTAADTNTQKPAFDDDGPKRYETYQKVGLFVGIALFFGLLFTPKPDALTLEAWKLLAVITLMAVWWATEALPIPATSLLPIILFPLLEITSVETATRPYSSSIIYLFLGGFIVALAVEKWNLHRRLALMILARVGNKPSTILLGFMAITAFLSMWVSNSSATMMMFPIALSVSTVVMARHNIQTGPNQNKDHHFATALLLGVAYSASIGGLGTLIGTPPNALMAGYMKQTYGIEISFAQWMLFGVPVVLILIPAAWLIISRWAFPIHLPANPEASALMKQEYASLGRITKPQTRTAVVFAAVAIAWTTAPLIKDLTGLTALSDTVIALIAALALFFIPSGSSKGGFLMDWSTATKLPWGVLILFGSGLSMSEQVTVTGLDTWLSSGMAQLTILPMALLIGALVAIVITLTEFASNTATAATVLPILGALAIAGGIDPIMIIAPAIMAASCGFMLPAGTPPNAIVFGSGYITVPQMVKTGFWVNLASVVVLTIAGHFLLPLIFG